MANLTTDCAAVLSFSVDEAERDYPVLSYVFMDGRQQTLTLRTTKIRRWKLSYINQTATEVAALRAFWDAAYGAGVMFYWNNPETGETNIPVYFVADTWSASWVSPRATTVTVEIRESVA